MKLNWLHTPHFAPFDESFGGGSGIEPFVDDDDKDEVIDGDEEEEEEDEDSDEDSDDDDYTDASSFIADDDEDAVVDLNSPEDILDGPAITDAQVDDAFDDDIEFLEPPKKKAKVMGPPKDKTDARYGVTANGRTIKLPPKIVKK